VNFEKQKPIIFFSALPPRKEKVLYVILSMAYWFGGKGLGRLGGGGRTLLLYALYEDCRKRIDNTATDHAFLFYTQILDAHEL